MFEITILGYEGEILIRVTDYLLSTPLAPNDTQGCILPVTYVPNWLIALLFLSLLVCLIMTLWAMILWLRLRFRPHRAAVEYAPVDLWTWMAQAVTESSGGQGPTVKPKMLRNWDVELKNDVSVRVVRRTVSNTPGTQGPEIELLNGTNRI